MQRHKLFLKERKGKFVTCSGSEKSVGEGSEASRVESFSDGDEEMRRYGHISSDVLVDQGLMFKLHPL